MDGNGIELCELDVGAIRRFLTIVEAGSINAAAQRLHIAQPPLSRQMRQLEDRLGLKLFERGKRTVTLTEAGKLLQNRAGQVLGLLENTVKEMREIDTGNQGTLSIGTVTSSGATLLPKVAQVFRTQYPGVHFQLWEGETVRILELLHNGSVEIGMVRYPFDSELYESIKLPNEPLVAAMNRTRRNSWDGRDDFLRLKELAGQPLLIHRKYEAILLNHCEQAGFKPDIVCMSDDVMSILSWADADIGIAIVPRAAIGLIPSTNLDYQTLVDPCIETTAAVIWLKNRHLTAAARNFLDLFTRVYPPKASMAAKTEHSTSDRKE